MQEIIKQFFNIFGENTTTNFQLIKWAEWLKIKPFYYAMTNEIKYLPNKTKDFSAIINYHNSNQPGIHHVAFVSIEGKRYYFDSYGFEPQKEIIQRYSPLKASNYEIQKYGTCMCGQLSLLFIYLMNKGFCYEDVILSLRPKK